MRYTIKKYPVEVKKSEDKSIKANPAIGPMSPSGTTLKTRYLTKSRFKIGYECARKLAYQDDPSYANNKNEDDFLKALADGGFQVGELAKLYHPGGVDIDTLDRDEAIRRTNIELAKDNAIIYEAAIAFDHLFIRVDVLVKRGKQLKLIEVKAKSYNSQDDFNGVHRVFHKTHLKKDKYVLSGDLAPYVLDVAFQTYVTRLAYPQFHVDPYLMMADKSKTATIDGLHQFFLITKDERGRSKVRVKAGTSIDQLGDPVLNSLRVASEVDDIISRAQFDGYDGFEHMVSVLSDLMKEKMRAPTLTTAACKTCEFRVKRSSLKPGQKLDQKSGFEECWKEHRKLKDSDFDRAFVFDIWNFRSASRLVDDGVIFAQDVDDTDLGLKEERNDDKTGFTSTQRQRIQIDLEEKPGAIKVNREELRDELATFKYPLHFIDFETAMVAIPFFKGHRPYSQLAYQFSHHVLHKDGRLEERTPYLENRAGYFPNFDFVRALKKSLEGDDGTVFRFASHENTVLKQIRTQLKDSNENDAVELVAWIESLTSPSKDEDVDVWRPTRQFIDMRDITLRHTYLADTKGSNSIKRVLPAVLNHSGRKLQAKFSDFIKFDEAGKALDPYKLLPPIFEDVDPAELEKLEERLIQSESLNEGGAALVAWARMQFTEMSDLERKKVSEALLRYCSLDTLAMVMIWEWWKIETSR